MLTLPNWDVLESLLLGQKIVTGIDLQKEGKQLSVLFNSSFFVFF